MIAACWFCGGALRTDRDVLVFCVYERDPVVVLFQSCVACGRLYADRGEPWHAPAPPPSIVAPAAPEAAQGQLPW